VLPCCARLNTHHFYLFLTFISKKYTRHKKGSASVRVRKKSCRSGSAPVQIISTSSKAFQHLHQCTRIHFFHEQFCNLEQSTQRHCWSAISELLPELIAAIAHLSVFHVGAISQVSLPTIHNLQNGTVLIFSAPHRHPIAIVDETHSAGAVCSSQLNYLNIAKTKHASTLCCVQMHEPICTWVFCEVFVVRNFNFLLVWIVCSHTQFSSANASSPTAWRFSALCHLHRLCASVRRLCIFQRTDTSAVRTSLAAN